MKSEDAIPWGRAVVWLAAIIAIFWGVSVPVEPIPISTPPGGAEWAAFTITTAVIDTLIVLAVCLVLSFLGTRLAGERRMRWVILVALIMTSMVMVLLGGLEWYGATHIPQH